MRTSAWLRWVQVTLASLGMLSLLFALVAATYFHNVRFDLSPGDRFTLSDHGRAVLANLDTPVAVTGFIRTEDPRNIVLKDLLWQAARQTPLLTYEILDVNRNPALAGEFGVSAYGSAVVESGARRSDFSNPSESQLISAILYVTRPPKKVYYLTGHGECDINDTRGKVGCSLMRDALRSEFYDVEELSLFGDRGVPDSADVVVIAGPRSDPLESEIAALKTYLDQGGKVLALIDPYTVPDLVALFGTYGIEFADDIVLDFENRLGGGEPFTIAIPDKSQDHLITATLDAPPLFSGGRSVRARKGDDADDRMTATLLRSGGRSWASYGTGVLRGENFSFVAGRDLNGPLVMGVDISSATTDADGTRVRSGIVAFGNSKFANNRFLDYLGNRDLLVNSVNWLAREERLIATRAKRKTPGTNVFFVSQAQMRELFSASVMIQPGIFILIGTAIFIYRRFGR